VGVIAAAVSGVGVAVGRVAGPAAAWLSAVPTLSLLANLAASVGGQEVFMATAEAMTRSVLEKVVPHPHENGYAAAEETDLVDRLTLSIGLLDEGLVPEGPVQVLSDQAPSTTESKAAALLWLSACQTSLLAMSDLWRGRYVTDRSRVIAQATEHLSAARGSMSDAEVRDTINALKKLRRLLAAEVAELQSHLDYVAQTGTRSKRVEYLRRRRRSPTTGSRRARGAWTLR
jgi:hypothetical protein